MCPRNWNSYKVGYRNAVSGQGATTRLVNNKKEADLFSIINRSASFIFALIYSPACYY